MRHHALGILVVACCFATVVPAGRADSVGFAQFERYLDALRQQARIPGLSAAIVQEGQIVWEAGFGFQDVEALRPATPDTPYHLVDLTQVFSATLLFQCVEEGTLDLNEPIANYSTLVGDPGATIAHVMTHTSETPVGSRFRLDSGRFAALTPVIEACTGLPFRRAVATRIFARLGMQRSVPGQDLDTPGSVPGDMFDAATLERFREVALDVARPYRIERGRAVQSAYPERGANAAVGLLSTVRDLARFESGLNDAVLLRGDTISLLATPAATSSFPQPFGFGWFVQTYDGQRIVWQYGSWTNACSALIVRVPDRRLTFILLANSDALGAQGTLAQGDINSSLFARLFLRLFI